MVSKLIHSLIFLLLVSASQAQIENKPIREKLGNGLYVVLDEEYGEAYNTSIRDALAKHWNRCEVTYIEFSEVEELKKDINNLFLLQVEDEGIDGSTHDYRDLIVLSYFARSGRTRVNITGSPIKIKPSSKTAESLDHAIQVLSDRIGYEMAKQDDIVDDYEEYLYDRREMLEDKTIYITYGDLDIELSDVAKFYDGKVDKVKKSDIEALIASGDTKAAIAVVNSYKISSSWVITKDIIDVASGEFLYSRTTTSASEDGGFGKKEFKELGR